MIILPSKRTFTRQPQDAIQLSSLAIADGALVAVAGNRYCLNNNNGGVLIGNYELSPGSDGNAVYIQGGSNQIALCDKVDLISGSDPLTLETLVDITSTAYGSILFGFSTDARTTGSIGESGNYGTDRAIFIFPNSNSCRIWGWGIDWTTSYTFSANTKIHIAVVKGPGTTANFYLYINGVLVDSTSGTSTWVTSGPYFYFGGRHYAYSSTCVAKYYMGAAYKTALSAETIAAHAENPWQIFKQTRIGLYFASTTSLSVNLTGLSGTSSFNTFVPSLDTSLTGSFALGLVSSLTPVSLQNLTSSIEISSTSGTLSKSFDKTLTGSSNTLTQGSFTKDIIKSLLGTSFSSIIGDITPFISEDLNINLSGNQITLSHGSIISDFSKTISGIESTFSFGDILSLLSVTPSGISATVVNGIFSVILDNSITLTLTGQQAILALQALIGTSSFDITGNAIASSRGSFLVELNKVLSGQVANATYGIFTVEGTADRIVFLSGQSLQIVKDNIIPEIRKTPTGNVIDISLQPIIAELNKLLVSNSFNIVGETIVAKLDINLPSISGTLSFTAPFVQGQIVIDARASWKFLVKDNSLSFLIKE